MDQGRPGRQDPQGQRDGHPYRLHRGAALNAARRLAWHGFACDLPAGWEVTAYRLGAAKGEFRLHERLEERGQLTWVRLAAPPDREALLREIADRQARDAGIEGSRLRLAEEGPFLVADAGPRLPRQAVAFVPHDMRLLHWTFPAGTPEGEGAPWQALLRSCAWPAADEREWSLFGVRLLLPRAWEPKEVEAAAGAVTLSFVRRDGMLVTARRLALARRLLAEHSLPGLVRRHLVIAEKARVDAVEPARRGPWEGVHARWSVRGERPWDRVAWRRWPGESWAWHRADENRILDFAQVGPADAPRLDPDRACPP